MEESTSTTRTVADTSFEEQGAAKAARMDAEMPAWAATLLASMNALTAETLATNKRVDSLVSKINELEEKVGSGEERLAILEERLQRVELENASLRGEQARCREDLDKEIDSSLRDHLVFYGIPGSEKKWEDTAQKLAGWLETNVGGHTRAEFDMAIIRAHRGPYNPEKTGSRPIFAKINFRHAEKIQEKLKFSRVEGVNIRDQFSDYTQARVSAALVYRKQFKAQNPNFKAYISYPANVKTKGPEDTSYRVVKSF